MVLILFHSISRQEVVVSNSLLRSRFMFASARRRTMRTIPIRISPRQLLEHIFGRIEYLSHCSVIHLDLLIDGDIFQRTASISNNYVVSNRLGLLSQFQYQLINHQL